MTHTDKPRLDIMQFKSNVVELLQNIGKIILNLSKIAQSAKTTDQIGTATQILHNLVLKPEYELINLLKMMSYLDDYTTQLLLIRAIGNFLLPFHSV